MLGAQGSHGGDLHGACFQGSHSPGGRLDMERITNRKSIARGDSAGAGRLRAHRSVTSHLGLREGFTEKMLSKLYMLLFKDEQG